MSNDDFTPTAEQIEALAAFLFEREHGLEWDTEAGDDHDHYRRGAREILATPACQAITKAAQVQALREYADALESNRHRLVWDDETRLGDIRDWADEIEGTS